MTPEAVEDQLSSTSSLSLPNDKQQEKDRQELGASHTRPDANKAENKGLDLEKGPTSHHPGGHDPAFLVKWAENDPENPLNWSFWKKSWCVFQLGMLAMAGSAASAIIAPGEQKISDEFGISPQVTVFTVSLYVTGFIIGPSIFAPLSELMGRRISLLPATYALALFSIGTAVSKNVASIFATRLLAGIFGAAPTSNVAAALGDMYEPKVRGTVVSLYAIAVVGGPTIAPVAGAALSLVSWRWTEYAMAIFAFVVATIALFCLPEMYAPYLLDQRAVKLRKTTGDIRWHHPHEDLRHHVTLKSIFQTHFARPLLMLTTEPMVTCIAFYASFVFGILYMTIQFFPIVYGELRGWPLVTSSLPFLALFVGIICALVVNLANQPRYARAVDAAGGKPVPEARLQPMVIGGFLFTAGLFTFGWTADPRIPWPGSVIGAGMIGAGFNIIFQQSINFLVDTYRVYSASAVSANTLLRSVLGASLPFAVRPMFKNLGPGPALSIIGGITALALPVPFIFMKYGVALRRKSKYAPVD